MLKYAEQTRRVIFAVIAQKNVSDLPMAYPKEISHE
jgi:hypothetical protein